MRDVPVPELGYPPSYALYQRYHYASKRDDGSLWTLCEKFPVPNGAVTQGSAANCDECAAAFEEYRARLVEEAKK